MTLDDYVVALVSNLILRDVKDRFCSKCGELLPPAPEAEVQKVTKPKPKYLFHPLHQVLSFPSMQTLTSLTTSLI